MSEKVQCMAGITELEAQDKKIHAELCSSS
jgi:hypothetical protein